MSKGRAIQRPNPQYKIETVSKVYSDVNQKLGPEWWDSEHWEIPVSSPDEYEISEWIGSGKYSDVFIGYKGDDMVAMKVMKPVRSQKYNREAKILLNINGGPNIVRLFDIVQNPSTRQFTFIFEYVDNVELNELLQSFTDHEVKFYLFNIMKALQYAHSHGIMHRDVKPQNVMYDRQNKKLRLIDWGLAEFYHPGSKYNIHVASRHFKSIELLVDYQYYDYSIDIWSFGVTMASIVFKKMPFFKGSDDFDMVTKIVSVLGVDSFNKYINKYGIELPPDMEIPQTRGKKWSSFIPKNCEHLASNEALDLIAKCLRFDHEERITADEALNHPYFDEVRNEVAL
ncbi:CMGC family protein kinase [Histomonas meleagridis]|uniref:CMGC family protein kinase n=1 Tax=Histomonas meleagridis TaxID=135588 RepID=UPI00355A175F|nr:CMGC family protein kinase [Histomonas meleagridis]KAH0800898.1 CMGC family protein kinase [Histomonas meleagridis]